MANVRIIRGGVLAAVFLAGCSSSEGLRPVTGTVTGPGDVAVLAGSAVEIALESDPTVRASGTIEPDGRFTLDSLKDGRVRRGAPAGAYKARIVLGDDDPTLQKKAAKAVPAKYLKFETSGLTVRVPADGAVTLAVR
ncbi:hypothetical protein J0H58_26535 [bacterium]|nr:hypothetical protein [bacterium]